MALGPGAVVDRYVLDAVIGRGGMAVVYRAHHAQLGTPCAIKILMVPDATVRQRLVQEGRIQASLVHPHVVRVFDVVQAGDLPGLVMEWVDGPTLSAVASRYKLSLEQVDDIATALLDGVGAAHARGLVHRDLKPGNVLIEVGPRGVIPKVADFGLAKLVEGSAEDRLVQTSTGALMGTPAYMSPEQIRDTRGVDARTDIFSLGVILYELACGRRPFDQGDVIQLFAAIDAGKYPPPRTLRPDLPEGMERAIVGALAPDRDRRIPDCATLLATWRGGGDTAVPRSATGPWPAEQVALLRAAGAPVPRAAQPSTSPDVAGPTPLAAPSAGG
ncbi:MAG: serine/threonine protein kinase, partial [Deltaproteobacteria bacterium]|nr:serine/threonine protein kinase [Deltaproteobacteria bacterium]